MTTTMVGAGALTNPHPDRRASPAGGRRSMTHATAARPDETARRSKSFARVMLVLTLAYLAIEMPFAATLVDALATDLDHDAIHRVEMIGRVISGIAVALALAGWLGRKWIREGRSRAFMRRLVPIGALTILAVYYAEEKVVDAIAGLTTLEYRQSLAVSALARQHAIAGGAFPSLQVDLSDPGDRTRIGIMTFLHAGQDLIGDQAVDRRRLVEGLVPPSILPSEDGFSRDVLWPIMRRIEDKRTEIEGVKRQLRGGGIRASVIRDRLRRASAEERREFNRDTSTPSAYFNQTAIKERVTSALRVGPYSGTIHPRMTPEQTAAFYAHVQTSSVDEIAKAILSNDVDHYRPHAILDDVGYEIARAAVAPLLALFLSLAGAIVHLGKSVGWAAAATGHGSLVPLAGKISIIAAVGFTLVLWRPVDDAAAAVEGGRSVDAVFGLQRGLYPIARAIGEAGPYAAIFPRLTYGYGVDPFLIEREALGVTTGMIPIPSAKSETSIGAESVNVPIPTPRPTS